MSNKVVLPYTEENLPFTAYQVRGYEIGTLLAGGKDIWPYLYSFFINIFMSPRNVPGKFNFTFDRMSWFRDCGVFTNRGVKFDVDELDTTEKYVGLIKEQIELGWYPLGYFDEFYVPNKYSYNRRHFKHTFYIYGFDDDEGVFLMVGYTENSKFEKYKVPYENFYYACREYGTRGLEFVYPEPNAKFEFDLARCCDELREYLEGVYTGPFSWKFDSHGVNAVKGFYEYTLHQIEAEEYLDIRNSRFFMEYAEFMLKRLDFLFGNGYITTDFSKEYAEVAKLYNKVHLLYIKFNFTKNIGMKDAFTNIFDSIFKIESGLFPSLLRELEQALKRERSPVFIG
ncbi:MAG: hypothetical protein E7589_04030 [Ruminococcaceae bacterium]|nr:hypothetical protein [Oscillospiraceae bacterium]